MSNPTAELSIPEESMDESIEYNENDLAEVLGQLQQPDNHVSFVTNQYHQLLVGAERELYRELYATSGKHSFRPVRTATSEDIFGASTRLSEKEEIVGQGNSKKFGLAEIPLGLHVEIDGEDRPVTALYSIPSDTGNSHGTFGENTYIPPERFNFEGIAVLPYVIRGEQGRLLLRNDDEARNANLQISAHSDMSTFSEMLQAPEIPETVQRAADQLIEYLGDTVSPEQRDLLAKSLALYALIQKPEPESGFREVGRCFFVPGSFQRWAESIGVTGVGTIEYETYYGHTASSYHKANIVGAVVLDWTARQYTGKGEYPLVYKMDDHEMWYSGAKRRIQRPDSPEPELYLVGDDKELVPVSRAQYQERDYATFEQALNPGSRWE